MTSLIDPLFRLGGEIGDGWTTTPASLEDAKLHGTFREGALSRDKDPDQLPILLEDVVVAGGRTDPLARLAAIEFADLHSGPAADSAAGE